MRGANLPSKVCPGISRLDSSLLHDYIIDLIMSYIRKVKQAQIKYLTKGHDTNYLRAWDYVLTVRINAMMFVVFDNLVEAADAQIKLANALLLQGLKQQASVS